jgi:hypothetical protein
MSAKRSYRAKQEKHDSPVDCQAYGRWFKSLQKYQCLPGVCDPNKHWYGIVDEVRIAVIMSRADVPKI